jgi:hypothetical protein
MPCCAFAACIVGQLILLVGAVKGALFGRGAAVPTARNAAVEWRLDAANVVARNDRLSSAGWRPSRRALRGLALVAALELVIVLGVIYGVFEHLGHGVHVTASPHVHAAHE